MTSEKNTNGGKTTSMSNAVNHELATKGKKSQREIISKDGKFDYRRGIAAIERERSPGFDSEIHHEINNISDSNRGGDSDYVYSSSSDTGKKQEQNVKKRQHANVLNPPSE
jgi:hypothetical protein